MVVAARGLPPLSLIVATVLGGTLAAGGANAINMYVDRDIDKVMHRTQQRPLVTGVVQPTEALVFAIGIEIAGVRLALDHGQPDQRGAGGVGLPLLRVRVHALAEAHLDAQHRHRRRGRRRARAHRLDVGDRPPRLGADRAVPRHRLLDAAALLGAGHQVPRRLRLGRRADAAVGGQPRTPRRCGSSCTPSCSVGLTLVFSPVAGMGGIYLGQPRWCWAPSSPPWRCTLLRTESTRSAMRLFGYSITYITLLFGVDGRRPARAGCHDDRATPSGYRGAGYRLPRTPVYCPESVACR